MHQAKYQKRKTKFDQFRTVVMFQWRMEGINNVLDLLIRNTQFYLVCTKPVWFLCGSHFQIWMLKERTHHAVPSQMWRKHTGGCISSGSRFFRQKLLKNWKMQVNTQACVYQSTIWIGVLCVVLSAVFLGLSYVQLDLRWAGIMFVVLTVFDLLLFVILRHKLKKNGGNTDMCDFFKQGLRFCCKDRHDDGITRSEVRESSRSQTNDLARPVPQETTQRQNEIRTKLRSLERHINNLFREYTVVENRLNRLRATHRDEQDNANIGRIQEKLSFVQVFMTSRQWSSKIACKQAKNSSAQGDQACHSKMWSLLSCLQESSSSFPDTQTIHPFHFACWHCRPVFRWPHSDPCSVLDVRSRKIEQRTIHNDSGITVTPAMLQRYCGIAPWNIRSSAWLPISSESVCPFQDNMHREYKKLCRWFEGNHSSTMDEIEQSKEKLRNSREHLKSVQRRIDRIERWTLHKCSNI